MHKHYIDYPTYHRMVDELGLLVRQGGFVPDLVLGVARGGLLVADGLSRIFKVPMAVVAASSYTGEGGMQQGELRWSPSIASVQPVAGKVLLVDDLVDSGATLRALARHVFAQYPEVEVLKTAVLWAKAGAVFYPDFTLQQVDNPDLWLVQPFEVRDFEGPDLPV